MSYSRNSWRTAIALLFLFPMTASSQLIFQENFEGDDSNYELFDDGWEDSGDSGPATWGLNTDAERIGLLQAAPAKRAAILWKRHGNRSQASHMLAHSTHGGATLHEDLAAANEVASEMTERHYGGSEIYPDIVATAPKVEAEIESHLQLLK